MKREHTVGTHTDRGSRGCCRNERKFGGHQVLKCLQAGRQKRFHCVTRTLNRNAGIGTIDDARVVFGTGDLKPEVRSCAGTLGEGKSRYKFFLDVSDIQSKNQLPLDFQQRRRIVWFLVHLEDGNDDSWDARINWTPEPKVRSEFRNPVHWVPASGRIQTL